MLPGVISARRKLDEAWFFLRRVVDARQTPVEMGYYLSAFLTACGSVRDHVQRAAESDAALKATFAGWKTGLTADEDAQIKYIVDTRNTNVHERSIGMPGGSLATTMVVVEVNDAEFRVEQIPGEENLPAQLGNNIRPVYALRDYPGGRAPLFSTMVGVFNKLQRLVEAAEQVP